ncbi:hypothetical protein O0L34_g10472 [Tuta absoluta]|nr:hypothetical protein O0L34_g10472 [Tuta absoluta]
MPSRMSLRRTKGSVDNDKPSTSQTISTTPFDVTANKKDTKSDTASARLDLNLKPPRRHMIPTKPFTTTPQESPVLKTIENTIFSPTKLVEKKMKGLGVKNTSSEKVVMKIKEKLRKPRPLCVKKKIANTVLDKLLQELISDEKKLRSPKKEPEVTRRKSSVDKTTTELIVANDDKSNEPSEVENEKNDHVENKNNDIKNEKIDDVENKKDLEHEDDSSNSTFQLPSEFIADHHSDESLPLFETPKKLTTVDIQKDSSLEISENNEVVDIKVTKIKDNSPNSNLFKNLKLKIPLKTDKCALKFSPTDKEALQEEKLDIDVESFKNVYLNEVDRDFQCNFKHKHKHEKKKVEKGKLRTAIDFAVDATKVKDNKRKKLKRKLITNDGGAKKKPKVDKEIVLDCNDSNNIKLRLNNTEDVTESIDLTLDNPKSSKCKKSPKSSPKTNDKCETVKTSKNDKNRRLKKLKKLKNKKHRENIQVKIRFREKRLSLEINTKSKKKLSKNKTRKGHHHLIDESKLKQYILQYSDNVSPNKVLVKPSHDITPKKRNYVKLEKSPDALVQTSIQSFFKKVPTTTT